MPQQTQDQPTQSPASSTPFNPVATARLLLRTARFGALATLAPDGAPHASLVNVASDLDGTPLTLISRLAVHTQHILADARVSLLLSETGAGDPAAHPRISISARAEVAEQTDAEGQRVRERFLARHPQSAGYADFPDFAFYRLVPTGIRLVAGFGRINDLAAQDVLLPAGPCESLATIAPGATAHMNEDHADALALYATVFAGRPVTEDGWRATGIDPEGLDLMQGDDTTRILFPAPLENAAQLRPTLVAMAQKARESRV